MPSKRIRGTTLTMLDTFQTIAYAIAVGSIGFSLALALTQKGQRTDRLLFFCLLLIVLLVHMLGELLVASGVYRFAPHLVGADLAIRTMLGPSVFFYIRSLISAEKRGFRDLDWMSLTGPALVLLVSLPFAGLSAQEKLALADPATRNPDHYRIAVFTCTASLLIFLASTGVYLALALRIQSAHRARMMQQFANIERRSLDWLRTILFIFAGAWLCYAIKQALWLSGISIPAFNIVLAFTEAVAIAALAFLGVRQSELPADPANPLQSAPRRSILSEERMTRTAAKLTRALTTNALYADSFLSLRTLSDITGVTKNHISETLSQHLGVNFFDFVNSHRAQEAKRLLAETDLTIVEIALEVGFNSRSTFNAAFKKHVGSTPSAYRLQARKALLHETAKAAESRLTQSE